MAQQENKPIPKKRSSGRLVLILMLLWLIGVAASSVFLYFIPKAKGDSFAANLLNMDAEALLGDACGQEDLRQVGQDIIATGGRLGQVLVGVIIGGDPGRVAQNITDNLNVKSSYNILTGKYVFRFVSASNVSVLGFQAEAGFETPAIEVQIRNEFTSACVESS